ncbi:hypothetical protein BYT27DRAFT_7185242 [Phlegmacium glaucopus]|nr:hypothetical protein BYT27DRAFT_7185242 [Phlegmacium glaucopus]
MTDLPPLPNTGALTVSATMHGSYKIILSLENSVRSDPDTKKLIYARILGYLLLHRPSAQARLAVALEIVSCNGETALLANGKIYYDLYLRAFKMAKGPILTPSQHISRPSFDTRKSMVMEMLVEAPQNHREAKRNGLIRDQFCCLVSGDYDMASVEKNLELQYIVDASQHLLAETNCAHIFSESTNSSISGDNAGGSKHQYAASVWAVMDRFGYPNIVRELNGANIHRLQNVLTLSVEVHGKFDALKLWFEPTNKTNTYTVQTPHTRYLRPSYKPTVTFTTPDEDKLPVPSSEYLAIHAACAKVAHLSGAGEHIDKILREMEDTKVLSKDGASAEILEHALLPLSQAVYVH